jgi:hypothetical protein
MTLGIGQIIHDSSVMSVGRTSMIIIISSTDGRKNKRQLRDHEKMERELEERRNKKLRYEKISEREIEDERKESINIEEENMSEME